MNDVLAVPRVTVAAYTKAKTLAEVAAYELDRRLRAEGTPVISLLSRPGVGVDAKTPRRPGIHDETTPHRRNPYTPWARGKDTAAWAAVRALSDPSAHGGDYFAPAGALHGEPVRDPERSAAASPLPRQVGTDLGRAHPPGGDQGSRVSWPQPTRQPYRRASSAATVA